MPRDLLPAQLRARLRELRIASRRTSPLRGGGLHRSRDRGAGLEFSQYRAYEPGDELRRIDWKLYARSDRFFVREAERDSPLAVWVLLDASASMAQVDEMRPDWSRLDAGKALAAAIAEVAVRQGDRVGLAVLRDDDPAWLPMSSGPRHRDRVLLALHDARAQGGVPGEHAWRLLWERIAPDEMVVYIGDCFDEASLAQLERMARARREISVIQVLTAAERDFPFTDGRRFVDPETGEELPGDGAALRDAFLARFGEAQRVLHARFDAAGIRHAICHLDAPLDLPLRTLFPARAGGVG